MARRRQTFDEHEALELIMEDGSDYEGDLDDIYDDEEDKLVSNETVIDEVEPENLEVEVTVNEDGDESVSSASKSSQDSESQSQVPIDFDRTDPSSDEDTIIDPFTTYGGLHDAFLADAHGDQAQGADLDDDAFLGLEDDLDAGAAYLEDTDVDCFFSQR